MSETVSRKKYETIKRKAEQWRDKALEAFEEVQELREELERFPDDNSETVHKVIMERDKLLKELNTLQKRMGDEVFKQEREMIRKNGEIDRLKMSLSDYKDRYQEIREDNKELRKSIRVVGHV
jgi:uncharacterized coiled-coil DUF342 family protein|tara:strand:+ start:10209 stop:10577 length:369 start_codon:yes stop_codon:yes gene_type:complete